MTEPVMKPGKITWASYELVLEPENGDIDLLTQQCSALFSQPEIPVDKHTKSGMIHFDLKPYLAETSFKVEENTVRISAFLPAGSEKNISPYLLTDALEHQQGASFLCEAARTGLYDAERKLFE